MEHYYSARLRSAMVLTDALEAVAVALAQEMRKRMRAKPRPRGATVRPGVATPLWNALVAAVVPRLRPRGAKALLARELALDKSRMTDFFVRRSAMPDAERTLELMIWLAQRREGRGPAEPKRRRARGGG